MKIFDLILFVILIYPSCNKKISESEMSFKASLKGTFDLPWSNTVSQKNDSLVYFLIDTKLKNNSNKQKKFVSYTCTSIGNIVADTKFVELCINHCRHNSITSLELKPGQELDIPIIVQVRISDIGIKTRFGWIMIDSNQSITKIEELLDENRKTYQNVIWSDSIRMGIADGIPYEIR